MSDAAQGLDLFQNDGGYGREAFFLLFFLSGVKFGFLPQESRSLIAHLREVLILPAHTLPT